MFENRPVMKERLSAAATFSGIAIAAVAGFEMVITGGFDFLTPGAELREIAPSSYVTVERTLWEPEARVIPLSSTEPYFAQDPYYSYPEPSPAEPLAGSREDTNAPDGRNRRTLSEEEQYRQIEREIAALYAQETTQREPAQTRVETQPIENVPPIESENEGLVPLQPPAEDSVDQAEAAGNEVTKTEEGA